MTKEELIKKIDAEIAKLSDNASQMCEEYEGYRLACKDISDMIHEIAKEIQPSLPSNLGDAAFAYGDRDGITAAQSYAMSIDFKAGAGWLAEQGQTFEAHVDNGCAIASGVKLPFILWDTYEDGDVLKVQIRKK